MMNMLDIDNGHRHPLCPRSAATTRSRFFRAGGDDQTVDDIDYYDDPSIDEDDADIDDRPR
jgi:hypothetical protein